MRQQRLPRLEHPFRSRQDLRPERIRDELAQAPSEELARRGAEDLGEGGVHADEVELRIEDGPPSGTGGRSTGPGSPPQMRILRPSPNPGESTGG